MDEWMDGWMDGWMYVCMYVILRSFKDKVTFSKGHASHDGRRPSPFSRSDKLGQTALHLACERGHGAVVPDAQMGKSGDHADVDIRSVIEMGLNMEINVGFEWF